MKKTSKRRGRPRGFDEQVVLRKVAELFWDQGFAGTSLDMLSEVSGLTRPSLYGAFGNKQEIFLSAQLWFRQQMLSQLDEAISTDQTLPAVLTAFFETAVNIYTEAGESHRGCFVFLIGAAEAPKNEKVQSLIEETLEIARNRLAGRLTLAVECGDIKEEVNVEAAAQLCLTLLNGLSVQARSGVGSQRLRENVAIAVKAALAFLQYND